MKGNIFSVITRQLSSAVATPKICIIGAGPAGFYSAQHLAKKLNSSQIDIYERLPVPFGLVRFGVAPDHPEVKNVENTFTKVAGNPNVRFIGNVTLGKDVTLSQLKKAYHAVLLSYGAEVNRKLDIPGENLKNVIPARHIVGWYNGVPWDSDLQMDLSAESVAILGQGNVAIDVARILLSPIDKLKTTDITQHALEALSKSKVKKVYLIGRRGPLQAAFTIAELREMLKLEGCATVWNSKDFEGLAEVVPSLPRPKKRITELMLKSLNEQIQINPEKRAFLPVFHRAPLEILDGTQVEGVRLAVTRLEGGDLINKKAVLTDETDAVSCQLAVTSIGYRSVQADGEIPFDEQKGVVINNNFSVDKGVFTSGWLSTGPTGVILTTMSNAFAAADVIVKYIQGGGLLDEQRPGFEYIESLLKQNNVQIVSWKNWLQIDAHEQEEGKKLGKPREKITDIQKMLDIAG